MADFLTLTWDSLFKERNKGGEMKRQKLTKEEILINKIIDKIYEMSENKSLSAEQQLAVNKIFEEVMLIIKNNEEVKGG